MLLNIYYSCNICLNSKLFMKQVKAIYCIDRAGEHRVDKSLMVEDVNIWTWSCWGGDCIWSGWLFQINLVVFLYVVWTLRTVNIPKRVYEVKDCQRSILVIKKHLIHIIYWKLRFYIHNVHAVKGGVQDTVRILDSSVTVGSHNPKSLLRWTSMGLSLSCKRDQIKAIWNLRMAYE